MTSIESYSLFDTTTHKSRLSSTSLTTSSSVSEEINWEFLVRPCNCSVDLSQKGWSQYDTLHDLAANSSAIIVGNVTSEETAGVNDSALFGGGKMPLVPVTYYNVTVSSVLTKGSGLEPGHSLIVPQVGGTIDHTTMNVTGYPTLSIGHSYVFFLTRDTHIPEIYADYLVTTGAAQGLFYIQGGKVYSLDNMYPKADAWLLVKAAGVPLSQFIAEVQAGMSSSTTSTASSTTASNSTSTASTSSSATSSQS